MIQVNCLEWRGLTRSLARSHVCARARVCACCIVLDARPRESSDSRGTEPAVGPKRFTSPVCVYLVFII